MVRRSLLALAAVAFVMWAAPASADDLKAGTHEGKVVKVDGNKLTMSDKDGKNEHTHAIPADAKITVDGKDAKLADLKAGTAIKVTAEKKGDAVHVTKIEAGGK
jgi:Cu/Ag efflux protein CusF